MQYKWTFSGKYLTGDVPVSYTVYANNYKQANSIISALDTRVKSLTSVKGVPAFPVREENYTITITGTVDTEHFECTTYANTVEEAIKNIKAFYRNRVFGLDEIEVLSVHN